jgi:TetR/AcrR family transcriptional regulator, regulator of mycofactocin system
VATRQKGKTKGVRPTARPVAPPKAAPGRTGRRQQSRERVIQAAMDLFVRQGFDQTTVKQIVAAGGISMRTFFRYFPTKMDLAFPHGREGTALLASLLLRHHDPAHPLRGVSAALVEFSRWYDGLKHDLLREWTYESRSMDLIARGGEIQRTNQGLIAAELEACGLPGVEARHLASVIFGGILANLDEWFGNECRDDLLDLSANTLALIRGLERIFPASAAGGR